MNRIHALNIILAILCFIILAKLASDILSYRLAHTFPKSFGKVASVAQPAVAEDLMSFSPVLEKGLFGVATRGTLTPILENSGTTAAQTTSRTDLVLLGTALGSYRETYALIQKTSTREERVFRLGDRIYDLGTLVSVKKEQVVIKAGGQQIKLMTPVATGTDTGRSAPGQEYPQPTPLATAVGSGSYVVDQRALNASLDNIGQAMTDARLLPSVKDGKVEGFRVSEVKPAGIFGMVGIKNGDVLLHINDFPIDSPDKAIQSLVSLKGQSRIKLDLIRDGQPVTLNYDIR
ncbi:MAG TPA: type II secretion system protein N [Geobacteraceae bacterium]|nr:type II secretion system protein N [Geobacteraceae bacterium]